jgi:hypothetical protein
MEVLKPNLWYDSGSLETKPIHFLWTSLLFVPYSDVYIENDCICSLDFDDVEMSKEVLIKLCRCKEVPPCRITKMLYSTTV